MKYVSIAACALMLVGCGTTITEVRTVEVPKPIPFCPAPPAVSSVPPNGFLVDKLTDDDIKDPGKIAQSYKYDMLFLREMISVYQQIIDQYQSTSQDFEKTNQLINELYSKMNAELARQNEAAKKRKDQ